MTAVALTQLSPSAGAQDIANVALGKSFACSDPGGLAWRGLLDGVTSSDEPPGCFATGNGGEFPKRIVIDLGALYDISKVIVHSSKNGNTRKVDVWASKDGQNYTQLRMPYTFPPGEATRMSAGFPQQAARYVKVAFWDTHRGGLGGDNVMYVREVEVLGNPKPRAGFARARPEVDGKPRSARMFAHYALAEGATVNLVVLGDDAVAGEPGLGAAISQGLKDRFGVGEVNVTDAAERGMKARDASSFQVSIADENAPDLIVVALGTADAMAFDPATYRSSINRLVDRLTDRTHGQIVVVLPPVIPHSAELGRAGECNTADTADTAWQLVSVCEGTDVAVVDAAEAIERSGISQANAYSDNLTLSEAGREVVAAAVVSLFR